MTSILWTLAWRNIYQGRARTIFSALSVTLGTSTLIAADVTGQAIRDAGQALGQGQDTVAFTGDLINTALSLMGLIILIAAAFLIFNAFGMAVTQRQRQIGALRSLGMTRRQILRLILAESLLTGMVGALLGVITGPLLGRGLVTLLAQWAGVAHGQPALAIGSVSRALILGIGVAVCATLLPAWRAMEVAPLVALRTPPASAKRDRHWLRAVIGALLIMSLSGTLLCVPPGRGVLLPPWDFILTGLCVFIWLSGLALILPALIGGLSVGARRFSGRWGATGRLIADNLGRARWRVTLTLSTLIIGLMMIVSVTGVTTFAFEVVLNHILHQYDLEWIVAPLPSSAGRSTVSWEVLSRWNVETMRLTPEFMTELEALGQGRAHLMRAFYADVPQLAVLSGLPSYVVSPPELRRAALFTFTEGDWETAQPIMASGCGLLLMPRLARTLDVALYDTLDLPGVDGPVTCTVAGLGTSSFMGTSLISVAAMSDLGVDPAQVFVVIVQPLPGVDQAALRADLDALLSRYPDNSLMDVDRFLSEGVSGMVDSLQVLLNGMLLLAILAAALGVINTTMLSVSERRREMGLLRALGSTRRQVRAVVMGEAALTGVIGGGLGLVAGVGLVLIFVAVNGGNMWGLSDLPLWPTAWRSVQPALLNGLVGLVAAPLLCAGAAWLPTRPLLRGPARRLVIGQRN